MLTFACSLTLHVTLGLQVSTHWCTRVSVSCLIKSFTNNQVPEFVNYFIKESMSRYFRLPYDNVLFTFLGSNILSQRERREGIVQDCILIACYPTHPSRRIFLFIVLLQLSQFSPFALPCPAHPPLPQSIPTPLSMSMGHLYLFLD